MHSARGMVSSPLRGEGKGTHCSTTSVMMTYFSWSLESSFLCSHGGDFPLPGRGGCEDSPVER